MFGSLLMKQEALLLYLSNEFLLRDCGHFDVCTRVVAAWATEFPEYGMLEFIQYVRHNRPYP